MVDAGGLRIIAHRGSHGPAGPAENTLPAFERAIAERADMVELDVWQTADGRLVIYHDETLPGDRRPISSLSDGEIQKLARDRVAAIPQLESALELMRGRIPVNVEIKHGEALVQTLRLIRDLRMQREVVLSSFVLSAMDESADLAPEIPRALIMGTESVNLCVRFREAFPFWALRRSRAAYWHPCAQLIGPAVVGAVARMGVQTNVWTINAPELARRVADWGAAGVFTDHPGDLRAALSN